MNIAPNPFIYGRAITPAEFLGREKELRLLFGHLAKGQSTAIVSQPHMGKTSLLNYILDSKARQAAVGNHLDHTLFSFLDAQTLHGVKTQPSFWELALAPVAEWIKRNKSGAARPVAAPYETVQKNQFGMFVLEQLLSTLNASGLRLALLLDEFDDFLSHPVLNSAEFYGGLRSLASRSQSLALIIASRRDLVQLNQLTQAIKPHGSPYFNVFTEVRLEAWPEKALTQLLDRAGERFDKQDRRYIAYASGQHPFVAQAAAAKLWEADEEGLTGMARYRSAGRALYSETKLHFVDTWQSWTNETRKAVTAVALTQIPRLLTGHEFLVSELIEDLDDYGPELEMLEAAGLLAEGAKGEWRITQGAFLWWLADELRRNVRDDTEFKTWLLAQEMDGLLTSKERQKMSKAVQGTLGALGKGASTLIEAFAKGLGEAASKRLTA